MGRKQSLEGRSQSGYIESCTDGDVLAVMVEERRDWPGERERERERERRDWPLKRHRLGETVSC